MTLWKLSCAITVSLSIAHSPVRLPNGSRSPRPMVCSTGTLAFAARSGVRNPGHFDVIVTSNLFGDILSDEASMITGSIGMLPSASRRRDARPVRAHPRFRAGYCGERHSKPLAAILSAAMLLPYSLGQPKAASAVEQAVQSVLRQGLRTADIAAGKAPAFGTVEMGKAVCRALARAYIDESERSV